MRHKEIKHDDNLIHADLVSRLATVSGEIMKKAPDIKAGTAKFTYLVRIISLLEQAEKEL